MSKTNQVEYEISSGNIFADIGVDNPIKAQANANEKHKLFRAKVRLEEKRLHKITEQEALRRSEFLKDVLTDGNGK